MSVTGLLGYAGWDDAGVAMKTESAAASVAASQRKFPFMSPPGEWFS
jgi:hypothetical protein